MMLVHVQPLRARDVMPGTARARRECIARSTASCASSSSTARGAAVVVRAGKQPSSNGGRYYAGKGKYIRDDRGLVSKTGRDDLFTGGFAGGEKGLWAYRDELAEKNAAKALEKKKRARRESRDVSLAKDFGGMAGGFPGGEMGVKSFNATGSVPETPTPTLGWGPPTLGALAVVCGMTYYTTGELSADALVKTAKSVVDAVANGVNTAATSVDAGDAAEGVGAGLDVVGAGLGAAAVVFGQAIDLLPEPVKEVGSQAASTAFTILIGVIAAKILFDKAVAAVGSSIKIAILGACSGAIALKILNIL
jgi:hypothetical protein